MIKFFANEERAAVGHLNYPSPVIGLNPLKPLGPNLLGEHLWPVEISEDGKRVGFSLIEPGENA